MFTQAFQREFNQGEHVYLMSTDRHRLSVCAFRRVRVLTEIFSSLHKTVNVLGCLTRDLSITAHVTH